MPFQFPVHFLVHGKQLVVDLIEDLVVLSYNVLLDCVMQILKVYALHTKIKRFEKYYKIVPLETSFNYKAEY
jgi:hypothetical protein